MSHTEPRDASFSAAEVVLLHHAVRDFIVRGTLGNRSLPDGYGALHVKLVSSVRGTKTCATQQEWSLSAAEELIDTTEAAAILNCSERWVRSPRFRDKIAAREIGGRWLYPRQTVIAYANERQVNTSEPT